MIKRIGLWGFVLAGLAIALWGAVSWVAPTTWCRGVEMGPGDTCEKSSLSDESGGLLQTYEDRIAITREQAPFGVAAGVAIVAFGSVLVVQDARGARAGGSQPVSPIGP